MMRTELSGLFKYLVFLAAALVLAVSGCESAPVVDRQAVAVQEIAFEPVLESKNIVEKQDLAGVEAEVTQQGSQEESSKRQLNIYKASLLAGGDAQIRIDAATELMISDEPEARQILIDALKNPDQNEAGDAVCAVLSRSRNSSEGIRDGGDFIEPLLWVLANRDFAGAKPAAEAMGIFEYEVIAEQLEKMAEDIDLGAQGRLNAVYALKLRADEDAITELIKLLDDPDKQVAAACEEALHELLGSPEGTGKAEWNKILKELQRKNRYEIIRDRLVLQETKVNKLKSEIDQWRLRYIESLERMYELLADDAVRSAFLANHLGDADAQIKLWALEKVRQWRVGTKSGAEDIGPVLITLVSDENRLVRLRTAKLLSLMANLNSAEKLLTQLNAESDDEVKLEIFTALGEACNFAFSPESGIELEAGIKVQTFEWAGKYLADADPKKANRGAEVIKKLIEQNGNSETEAGKYLSLMAGRYGSAKQAAENGLRAELLGLMGGLCGQNVHRDQAVKIFEQLFIEALAEKDNLIRVAAVRGLIHVDSSKALSVLKTNNLSRDESEAIRKAVVELAGRVGSAADLVWLSEKIKAGGEDEIAWEAMRKIFERSEPEVLAEWSVKVTASNSVFDGQRQQSLLELAEQKAIGANKPAIIYQISGILAKFHRAAGQFDRSAEYLGKLLETAGAEQKEAVLGELLEVYIEGEKKNSAAKLVANRMLEKDLDINGAVESVLDKFLSDPANAGAIGLMAEISKLTVPEDRPGWKSQIQVWQSRLNPAEPTPEPAKLEPEPAEVGEKPAEVEEKGTEEPKPDPVG